jgi:hypothetical protein
MEKIFQAISDSFIVILSWTLGGAVAVPVIIIFGVFGYEAENFFSLSSQWAALVANTRLAIVLAVIGAVIGFIIGIGSVISGSKNTPFDI